MPAKTNINTQWGRVSNPDGTSPLGASAVNFGLSPLVDSHGRVIFRLIAPLTLMVVLRQALKRLAPCNQRFAIVTGVYSLYLLSTDSSYLIY
jgi:hypothetical protein